MPPRRSPLDPRYLPAVLPFATAYFFVGVFLHGLRFQVHTISGVFPSWHHERASPRRGLTIEGCFSIIVQDSIFMSSSAVCFEFVRVMTWHGNWSTSSGKGWRRDSWNSSGSGRWNNSGDSQPSWGKGNGKSWHNIVESWQSTTWSALSPAGLRLWQQVRWNQRSRLQSREA